MADLKLVGAVAIKVRPNAKGFKKETEDQVKDQLRNIDAKVTVKAKTELDSKKLKADAKAAGEEIEKQGLTLRVGLDWDSVVAAEKKLEAAVKDMKAEPIEVTLDPEGIAEAEAKLAAMKAAAKVDMKITPDEKGFQQVLDKINQVRRQKMEIPLEFGTSDQELDDLEQGMKAALFEASKITLTYGNDTNSIQKAIAQIEAELAKIDSFELPVVLSSEELEAAKDLMLSKLSESVVELKINYDDQGSLKAAKSRLEAMLVELGSEPLEVKFNEEDIQAKLARINKLIEEELVDPTVTIKPKLVSLAFSNDRDSLQKSLDQLDKELAKFKEIKVAVNADEESVRALRNDVQAQIDKTPIKIKYEKNAEGISALLDEIEAEIHRLKNKPLAEVSLALDVAGLRDQARQFRQEIHEIARDGGSLKVELERQSANQTVEEMNRLVRDLDGKQVEVGVNLTGTEVAAAQLAFLGRDRVVTFFTNVSQRSLATLEGSLKGLAGLNVLQDAAEMLENIFTQFDRVAVSAVNVATVVGSLVDTLAYAVTATAAVGEGMLKSLGLLAAAPAVLGAATVGYTIFTAAFNNFFDAFNKDPKIARSALEALPPLARKTVDSITGLYKGLANPIQERFWEHVGTTLSDSIEDLYPRLKSSLLNSTEAVGDFVAGVGRSFNKLSLTDDFDKMFAGFNGFFVNLSGASEPFFDAWNKFGVQGAQLLPQFGTWITKLAVQFDNWATALGPQGINKLIMEGVESLKAMWGVGMDVADMFGAIAKASGIAGASGLLEFERGLRRVADQMNGEPWQSKAATLFDGARSGASGLMEGFRDLGTVMGNSATQFSRILELLGTLGGVAITNLSAIFGVEEFQKGFTTGLEGLLQMMRELEPAARSLGGIIGNLGVIAGAAFASVGDTVSRMFGTVEGVVDKLTDNVSKIAPKLSMALSAIFTALTPLIVGLTDALNGVLGVVNSMDDSFVTVAVAAAAFFAMRGLASKFFDSLSGTSYFKNLEQNWVNQQLAAGRFVQSLTLVDGEMRKITTLSDKFSPGKVVFDDITSSVGRTAASIRTLHEQAQVDGMSKFRSSLSLTTTGVLNLAKSLGTGLLSALGGPWGVAIAAGAVALGHYAQKQQEADALAQAFSQTLNQQTGAITDATNALAAQNILNDKNNGFYLFETGAKTASEAIKVLGTNISDVADLVSVGGKKYDDFVQNLRDGVAAFDEASIKADAFGDATVGNTTKLDAWLKKMNITKGAISELDLIGLLNFMEAQRGVLAGQQAATDALNQGLSTSETRIKNFNDAMRIFNDQTSTADAKTRAFKDALDILNGKQINLEDAQRRVNDVMRNAGGTMREFSEVVNGEMVKSMKLVGGAFRDAEGNVYDFNGVIDATTGIINTTGTAGSNLYQALQSTVKGVQDVTGEMKAQKKPAEDIIKFIDGQRDAFIKMGKEAGVNQLLVEAAWDHMMGANPKEINTLIKAQGVEEASARIRDYKGDLETVDAYRAVAEIAGDDKVLGEALANGYDKLSEWNTATATATMDLDPSMAQAKKDDFLRELMDVSRTNPKILVDIDPALLKAGKALIMEDLKELNNQRPSPYVDAQIEDAQNLLNIINTRLDELGIKTPQPRVDAQTAEADAKLKATYDNVDRIGGQHPMPIVDPQTLGADARLKVTQDNVDRLGGARPQPIVDPQTAEANRKLETTKWSLDWVGNSRPAPYVNAQTGEAAQRISNLQAMINNLTGKSVTMTITTQYLQSGNPVVGAGQVYAPAANGAIFNFRNNGLVKSFANGGIENHVAQIQRAGGPVRIWAEPETKAEAYIPYAQAKRPRSLSILAQVAKDFGYTLSKAQKYADGAIVGGAGAPTRTSNTSVTVGVINTVDPEAAVSRLRNLQQDALAVAGIR